MIREESTWTLYGWDVALAKRLRSIIAGMTVPMREADVWRALGWTVPPQRAQVRLITRLRAMLWIMALGDEICIAPGARKLYRTGLFVRPCVVCDRETPLRPHGDGVCEECARDGRDDVCPI